MMFTEVPLWGNLLLFLSLSHVFILQDIQIAVLRFFATNIRGEENAERTTFLEFI